VADFDSVCGAGVVDVLCVCESGGAGVAGTLGAAAGSGVEPGFAFEDAVAGGQGF
jgi:hypothetical protein